MKLADVERWLGKPTSRERSESVARVLRPCRSRAHSCTRSNFTVCFLLAKEIGSKCHFTIGHARLRMTHSSPLAHSEVGV